MSAREDWQRLQDEFHEGTAEVPWPHLRPGQPRERLLGHLRAVIAAQARSGSCRAWDLGAGHGSFTAELLDAGATEVVCTEMSERSAEGLRGRFAGDPRVSVVYDPDAAHGYDQEPVDLLCMIAVLHHIPDYVGELNRLAAHVRPGGALITMQDPTYYPRRRRLTHWLTRGSYAVWRVGRGDLWNGAKTVWRRNVGTLDERNPRDMVEYHAVRKGVDELAVVAALQSHFESVELVRYWSSHSTVTQRVVDHTRITNVFGVVATGRRALPER